MLPCRGPRFVRFARDSSAHGKSNSRHSARALPADVDFIHQVYSIPQNSVDSLHSVPGFADFAGSLQSWLETHAKLPDLRPVPPAYAADIALPDKLPPLEEGVKYLYGADGQVLREPSSQRPYVDDWFNGAVGIQASIVKALESGLRFVGVPQAFGWAIFIWTFIFKLLLFPLEKDSLRMSAMTKMLAPKVEQIQKKFKDDEATASKRKARLYEIFDIGLASGCLPLLVQLPLIFTLFYTWRRLAAEKYASFSESFLWVPSLQQPNPDFNFRLDWLLEFNDAGPLIGWDTWIRQLILPALCVAVVALKSMETTPTPAKKEEEEDKKEDENPIKSFIFNNIGVILTAWITLELPQVMSVYYLAFYSVGYLEVEFTKVMIRKELPMFEIFERTGEFPEGNFDEVFFPESLHKECAKGNVRGVTMLLEEGQDINGLDEAQTPALGYAAGAGALPIIAQLCLSGADICKRDGQDNSVLHFACAYDRVEALKYLITFGRETRKSEFEDNKWAQWQNKNGLTCVDVARGAHANGTGQCLEFLNAELGLTPTPLRLTQESPQLVASDGSAVEAAGAAASARARAVD